MKVGDMIKLINSTRKNGPYAGKIGLIVDFDLYDNPVVNVDGELMHFHYTQIENVFGNIGKVAK